MHKAWSAMALLLASSILISSSVANPLATERVLEDVSGDYMVTFADGTSQADTTNPSMDLRFLDIEEHVDGFWFIIGLEALERPGDDFSAQANVWVVRFLHGQQQYEFDFIWGIDGGWRTDMYRLDASGGSEYFHAAAIERDFDAGTVRSFVPRDLLRDENGAPPIGGSSFTEFTVHVDGYRVNDVTTGEAFVGGRDTMPDEGHGGPYAIEWGIQSDGPIHMTSDLPFRSSNGAATTYLFELDVHNLDDTSHRYFFRDPADLPAGWEIRFPADGLVLEAKEARTLPVLVSLPFAHQHGVIERTIVELEADDPSIIGRTEIGVLFLETPQPSGHHPQLWFHSNEQVLIEEATWHQLYTPGADVYMNTLQPEGDEGDAGIPIRGYSYDDGYEWYVFLEPGLLTGLDFRVGEEGTLSVPLSVDRPVPEASLSGTLFLMGPETSNSYDDRPDSATRGDTDFGGRNLTPLMDLVPTDAADLSGSRTFETPLSLRDGIDVVKPQTGQTLMLRLRLDGDLPAAYAGEPTLDPGATMSLPLDEYADPVDTSFLTDAITITATTDQERWANPGDQLLLKADVTNPSSEPLTVGFELSGQGAAWAVMHGFNQTSVAPGETVEALVILSIPATADHADRADIVLEAYDAEDPSLRSLVRFVAHVDTEEEWDDDATEIMGLEDVKEAPVGWIALLAIAMAALLRRTRI